MALFPTPPRFAAVSAPASATSGRDWKARRRQPNPQLQTRIHPPKSLRRPASLDTRQPHPDTRVIFQTDFWTKKSRNFTPGTFHQLPICNGIFCKLQARPSARLSHAGTTNYYFSRTCTLLPLLSNMHLPESPAYPLHLASHQSPRPVSAKSAPTPATAPSPAPRSTSTPRRRHGTRTSSTASSAR